LEIISIGHNNFIPNNRISMILQVESRPIKNLISRAREIDKLIDASNGKKRKSVIVTTDGYVVLSSIAPRTLAVRFQQEENNFE
jgi:hypothetical protein